MSRLRRLLATIKALVRLRRAERDLHDELAGYSDAIAAEHQRRGLDPESARRAALVELEGVEKVKELVRDVRPGSLLASASRDIRYGARVLWRSPGYVTVVVLTMALGIGVNAAMFSVLHAVLWRTLPYPDPAGLVTIAADTSGLPSATGMAGPIFDIKAHAQSVVSIAQVEGRDATLEIDGVRDRVAVARVTDEAMPLLGLKPVLGRSIVVAEDIAGVVVKGVVISHELWQTRLGGAPDVIGRRIRVNNRDADIVGVLPPDVRLILPTSNHAAERVDLWLPRDYAQNAIYRGMPLIGRLGSGVTIGQAQAELNALTTHFAQEHPSSYPRGLHLSVSPLTEAVTGTVKPALFALGGAVGFVLLIACVNVANLLLARAKKREREFAVRRALGATRARLVRQLLAEQVVLGGLGGLCGLLIAWFGIGIVEWLRPVGLPRQAEIRVNDAVVLWTTGITLLTSIVFGLVPALALTSGRQGQLIQAGRAGSLMLRNRGLQRGLVVSEVALSIVPLVAAGLLIRTFGNLIAAPIGFEPEHVVTARIPLDLTTFSTVERRSAFYEEAIHRVRTLPGVEQVSVGGPPPLAPVQSTQRVRTSGTEGSGGALAVQGSVMPGYLGVMGIRLHAGRDFSDDDVRSRRRVAIVDERLAAQLWNGNPVGQQLTLGDATEPFEVVAVVGQVRARDVRDADTFTVYVPSAVYEIEQTLVVRTHLPLGMIAPAIKQAVESIGANGPVFDIRSMNEIVEASFDTTRFSMLVLAGFGCAALALAGIGLYGTLAHLTIQRTQEFGVRMALGASERSILRLVIREGLLLTVMGAIFGLVAALGAARALEALLYGVTPFDSATLSGVVLVVAAVALSAVAWPAWRASQVQPVVALRRD